MAVDRERKERWLSEEEAELWAYVVRDAKLLRRRRRKAAARPASSDNDLGAPPTENYPNASMNGGASVSGSRAPSAAAPAKAAANSQAATGKNSVRPSPLPSPPPLANFDWRQARRLASGRDDIEARLDLHGRRQHEAYATLHSFLHSCQARGFRNVLVITGKGGGQTDDFNTRRFGDERGVLRRLAPEWLREPQFRQMVVSFTESHERHGGGGALYIKLRRAK